MGLARSPKALTRLMRKFATPESFSRAFAFEPRPSDVFLATFPKAGTTLVQQIVHGLRTRGDMDFRDISEVVPWIEVAFDLSQDPTAEQRANPRAFKTHLGGDDLPRGGRSIYIVREPEASLVSFYHFFSGWFFEPDAMDLETFALEYVLEREGNADYWTHLLSWWPLWSDASVLPLCYEDIVEDLPAAVRQIAGFLDLDASEVTLEVATKQAGIDFMKRSPTLWEDVLLREARNEAMGLPADASSTKVREGATKQPASALTDRVRETWAERWASRVEPATGFRDYGALRKAIREAAKR